MIKKRFAIYCTGTGCKEVSCLKRAMLHINPKDPGYAKWPGNPASRLGTQQETRNGAEVKVYMTQSLKHNPQLQRSSHFRFLLQFQRISTHMAVSSEDGKLCLEHSAFGIVTQPAASCEEILDSSPYHTPH